MSLNPHDFLIALLGTSPRTHVHDGQVPAGAIVPYAHVHTSLTPAHRPLSGDAKRNQQAWYVVCVNNTPTGARIIADQLVTLADNARNGDAHYRVAMVSLPVEDLGHPLGPRWSVTVEIHYLGKRTL